MRRRPRVVKRACFLVEKRKKMVAHVTRGIRHIAFAAGRDLIVSWPLLELRPRI